MRLFFNDGRVIVVRGIPRDRTGDAVCYVKLSAVDMARYAAKPKARDRLKRYLKKRHCPINVEALKSMMLHGALTDAMQKRLHIKIVHNSMGFIVYSTSSKPNELLGESYGL